MCPSTWNIFLEINSRALELEIEQIGRPGIFGPGCKETVRISASLREHEELRKDRASRKIDPLYTRSVNKVLYPFKLREVAQLIYDPDIRDYVHNDSQTHTPRFSSFSVNCCRTIMPVAHAGVKLVYLHYSPKYFLF